MSSRWRLARAFRSSLARSAAAFIILIFIFILAYIRCYEYIVNHRTARSGSIGAPSAETEVKTTTWLRADRSSVDIAGRSTDCPANARRVARAADPATSPSLAG